MAFKAITRLTEAPNDAEFVSLEEHQSSTPATFGLEENPVLYHKSLSAQVSTSSALADVIPATENERADFYVTSSDLQVWLPEKGVGAIIPYPCITLHAIQRNPTEMLYLQIDYGDDGILEWLVVPRDIGTLQLFYDRLSDCAALHPDFEENEDGQMQMDALDSEPPAAMGPWITAENVGEADDIGDTEMGDEEDGISAAVEVEIGGIGARAGMRRTRDDNNDSDDEDNDAATNADSKWRRT
ncbi:hypothetical protein TRVA0_002S03268 [Trichomonascus vanleenenianus]|uniref:uncharacterized protein n=1 Tax=Trichomonascus vanleenenianus TaxID=2268995 RepID=UPI003ECA8344